VPVQTIDQHTLDSILDQLDIGSEQARSASDAQTERVCHRRAPRQSFRSRCVIRFLSGGFERIGELPGRTRNLSRGGVAVLVRRVFQKGDPVEVEIPVKGGGQRFLAGLVTFCRYAGRAYHELGIVLKVTGSVPVFSDRFEDAVDEYDWLEDRETGEA
jgi:hypothetical protein